MSLILQLHKTLFLPEHDFFMCRSKLRFWMLIVCLCVWTLCCVTFVQFCERLLGFLFLVCVDGVCSGCMHTEYFYSVCITASPILLTTALAWVPSHSKSFIYQRGFRHFRLCQSDLLNTQGLPETCSKLWIRNLPPSKFSNNWCKSNTEVWACFSLTWWRWLHVRVSQILNHPCHVLCCIQLWIIYSVHVFSD